MSKLKKMFGYEPNIHMKRLLLQWSKEQGKSIEQVAGEYLPPPLFIKRTNDPNETFDFHGERLTLAQFHERYPFLKIVVITRRSMGD